MKKTILLPCIFSLIPLLGNAEETNTYTKFERFDWEITCDNTYTCRIAGYPNENDFLEDNQDGSEHNASIYFEKKAGTENNFSGKIQLTHYNDQDTKYFNQKLRLGNLFLNGKDLGTLKFDAEGFADLNNSQIMAIIAVAKSNAQIEVRIDNLTWNISDRGMSAVLLKMQDFQKNKSYVSPLKLNIPTFADLKEINLNEQQQESIKSQLQKLFPEDAEDCFNIASDESTTAFQLNDKQILIDSLCSQGAYNETRVILLSDPNLTSLKVIESETGNISVDDNKHILLQNSQKVRGIGDCWANDKKAWNGNKFITIYSSHTGLCRGFGGGAWEFPTFVSDIK